MGSRHNSKYRVGNKNKQGELMLGAAMVRLSSLKSTDYSLNVCSGIV